MTMVLLRDWQLQTNPFSHAGVSLTPQADSNQLDYYLDFYDWKTHDLLSGLSPKGAVDVSKLRSAHTVTILISGIVGSGRTSVKNLLLYELEKVAVAAGRGIPDSRPIVLEVKVPLSTDQQKAALALSMLLITAAKRRSADAAKEIEETLVTWQRINAGGSPDVETLFQNLQVAVSERFPGVEIIVVLDALEHTLTRDTARAANSMLKGFANYVIISLTQADDARFIRDELSARRPTAWVNATKVTSNAIKGYVARRNAAHRIAGFVGPDQIFPFTDRAIDYLFKATAGAGQEGLTIGIALDKLTHAMIWKAKKPGPPPSVITETDMKVIFG